uniref:nuclear transport factor 2 family protein n=1 Tax=uncultured Caulobacter sp. TaxID=158749 RepID=UPI0025E257D3|nr:nuclear transport factor 2 family protein [uncultured Caulobacter sp.]
MLALVIAALVQSAAPPQADPEDKAVLAVAQAFFDGMEAGSTQAMRATVLPNAQFMGVRKQPDGTYKIGRVAFEDSFGKRADPGVKEWMWSPVIIRRGGLATLTAPYEVSRDGKTLHCGIDVFTLAKQDGAWKIASISWTAEPDACPELRKL